MTPLISDPVAIAIVALCASVPVAAVALVALLRGYTISVHLKRPRSVRRRRRLDE